VPETGKKNLTVPDWAPAVNVAETPREYLIKVELPEVGKGDIKVSVEDGVLCIDGERPARDKKYHRVERAYSCCFRSFAPRTTLTNRDSARFSRRVFLAFTSPSHRTPSHGRSR
jgi:HSP20 family molecular chaperone IbpA